ncbi:MAG: hypothetical protein EOO07_00475 [Chitinophagaceae bacterium]|nr:MAG: hypothetical protein EOO07_00475 [Chitinophagaceae bacterium]
METNYGLSEDFRLRAEKHFVLLQAENIKKKRDSLSINLSGYSDVAYLMSDIVKVCILALGGTDSHGHARIPEPKTNISGVMSILLDLVPYEEFELLDQLRSEILNPVTDWDFLLDSITVTPAWAVD